MSEDGRRSRFVGTGIRILVSVAILSFLLLKVVPRDVASVLKRGDVFFLSAALSILLIERVIGVLRWTLLTRVARPGFPVRDAVSVFFLSNFLGLALPVSLGGDLVRFVGTARVMGAKAQAFHAVLYDRIFGLLSLLLMLVIGAYVAPGDAFGPLPASWIVGFGLAILCFLMLPLHHGFVSFLCRMFDRPLTASFATKLKDYGSALADRRITPVAFFGALLLSMMSQCLKCVFVAGLGSSVGIDLPLAYYFGFVPVVSLVAQIPISLGGIGLREGAFYVLLGGILSGNEEAGPLALAVSVLTYLGILVSSSPGLLVLILRGRLPIPGRWIFRGFAVFIGIGFVVASLVVFVDPLRRRLPWRTREGVERIFVRGDLVDKRIYFDRGLERLHVQNGDRVLSTVLYRPAGEGPHPGVVLLHGSNRLGRRLCLYRVLARELARNGRMVLLPDLAGFGESDDPRSFDSVEDWDGVSDTLAAVEALGFLDGVDSSRIDLIGHSLGGGVALAAGLNDPSIRRIVCLGPGRRLSERLANVGEQEMSRKRFARDRQLEEIPPLSLVLAVGRAHDIEQYLDVLTSPGHKPLLLADGELEDPLDLAYLNDVVSRIAPPKKFYRLKDTAHYLNVQGFSGDHSFGVYDRAVLTRFVDVVEEFLQEEAP